MMPHDGESCNVYLSNFDYLRIDRNISKTEHSNVGALVLIIIAE